MDECKPLNVGSTRMISENEYEISLRADTNNPKYRSGLTPHSSLLTPHSSHRSTTRCQLNFICILCSATLSVRQAEGTERGLIELSRGPY